ncbi:MAG: replication initiation protein, partial [Pseudomonadota bacterium]
GVSDRLARQWIAEHGEEYVAAKLTQVEGREGVKSPVRYLSAAIQRDFQDPVESQPVPPSEEALAAVDAAKARQADDLEREAALVEEGQRRTARLARVAEIAARRTPTQRDADRRMFMSTLADPIERSDFQRFGWNSALNATAIFAFWDDLEPGVFDGVP